MTPLYELGNNTIYHAATLIIGNLNSNFVFIVQAFDTIGVRVNVLTNR